MNSNEHDRKLFRLAVETLRDELRASSEGTPIRCVARLKVKKNMPVGGLVLWLEWGEASRDLSFGSIIILLARVGDFTIRLVKKSHSSKKPCENPNEIEGHFFKTCLFHHPVSNRNQVVLAPTGRSAFFRLKLQ